MSTLDSQTQLGVSAEVDRTFSAARVSLRPTDYIQYGTGGQNRVLGHYNANLVVPTAAWAANAVLAVFRNPDPSALVLLWRISVNYQVTATVTTQLTQPISFSIARGMTTNPTTNATAVSAGGSGRARSSMSQSFVIGSGNGAFLASAAAGLSGQNGATDSLPFTVVGINNITTANTTIGPVECYSYNKNAQHPIALSPNDAVVMSWGSAALATGSVSVLATFEWAEVPVF